MIKKAIIAFFLVIVFIIFLFNIPQKSGDVKSVRIAGQDIKVELAITNEAHAQGLSGRQGLNENEGMLFVFDKLGKYPFWMKDMNFPIDIIWLNEEQKVVYIEKNAQPESYPDTFDPKIDAKYVLEVISGFSEKNNLQVGDSALFTY